MRCAGALVAACSGLGLSAVHADTYEITMDEGIRPANGSGRLILFFIGEGSGIGRAEPRQAPFYQSPQPIASGKIDNWPESGAVTIDNSAISYPGPLDSLDGTFRVQAVFDCDRLQRGHNAAGNLKSSVESVTVSSSKDDHVVLRLTTVIPEPKFTEGPNLKAFSIRSEKLSAFAGHDVYLKAGVVLPQHYDERKEWAAMYIVPGFGGTWRHARQYAELMADPTTVENVPQCLNIVLDPDCPYGHHGFADSENTGPWGTALVTELIPALEKEFKLAPRPEGRLLMGHSSGGWTVLWLQLHWPEIFGGCWSSAPDPVDFTRLQTVNIYEDESYYTAADGSPYPSMRIMASLKDDRVMMTTRDEALVEYVIDPDGASGEQLATYDAIFSPKDPATGRPKRLFDPATGKIDHDVANAWARYDMRRIVASDWDHYGPIMRRKVRIACGTRDTFYLNLAVERMKEFVDRMQAERPIEGPGSIWLRDGADHGTILGYAIMRWTDEWMNQLKAAGL